MMIENKATEEKSGFLGGLFSRESNYNSQITLKIYTWHISNADEDQCLQLAKGDSDSRGALFADLNKPETKKTITTYSKSHNKKLETVEVKAVLDSWKSKLNSILKAKDLSATAKWISNSEMVFEKSSGKSESIQLEANEDKVIMYVYEPPKETENKNNWVLYAFCSNESLLPVIYWMPKESYVVFDKKEHNISANALLSIVFQEAPEEDELDITLKTIGAPESKQFAIEDSFNVVNLDSTNEKVRPILEAKKALVCLPPAVNPFSKVTNILLEYQYQDVPDYSSNNSEFFGAYDWEDNAKIIINKEPVGKLVKHINLQPRHFDNYSEDSETKLRISYALQNEDLTVIRDLDMFIFGDAFKNSLGDNNNSINNLKAGGLRFDSLELSNHDYFSHWSNVFQKSNLIVTREKRENILRKLAVIKVNPTNNSFDEIIDKGSDLQSLENGVKSLTELRRGHRAIAAVFANISGSYLSHQQIDYSKINSKLIQPIKKLETKFGIITENIHKYSNLKDLKELDDQARQLASQLSEAKDSSKLTSRECAFIYTDLVKMSKNTSFDFGSGVLFQLREKVFIDSVFRKIKKASNNKSLPQEFSTKNYWTVNQSFLKADALDEIFANESLDISNEEVLLTAFPFIRGIKTRIDIGLNNRDFDEVAKACSSSGEDKTKSEINFEQFRKSYGDLMTQYSKAGDFYSSLVDLSKVGTSIKNLATDFYSHMKGYVKFMRLKTSLEQMKVKQLLPVIVDILSQTCKLFKTPCDKMLKVLTNERALQEIEGSSSNYWNYLDEFKDLTSDPRYDDYNYIVALTKYLKSKIQEIEALEQKSVALISNLVAKILVAFTPIKEKSMAASQAISSMYLAFFMSEYQRIDAIGEIFGSGVELKPDGRISLQAATSQNGLLCDREPAYFTEALTTSALTNDGSDEPVILRIINDNSIPIGADNEVTLWFFRSFRFKSLEFVSSTESNREKCEMASFALKSSLII